MKPRSTAMILAACLWLAATAHPTATPVAHSKALAYDFVQKPYVQLGRDATGTSLEILWLVHKGEKDFKVEWRQPNEAWVTAENLPSYSIDVASIPAHDVLRAKVNPEPGRLFDYRVSKGGEVIFEATAHGRPVAGRAQTFAVFGDAGSASEAEAHVAQQVQLMRPAYVVMTGDLVYNDGTMGEYAKNFFPYFAADIASPEKGGPLLSTSTVIGVPGNHDLEGTDTDKHPDRWGYFNYWSEPLNGPLTTYGEPGTPTLEGKGAPALIKAAGDKAPQMANFSFDMGDVHWLVIDSNRYSLPKSPKLKAWIEQDLKATTKRWKFVTFHHPPFHSSKKHAEDKWMRALQETFEANGVDIVWNGHVHNYQLTRPIQTGAKKGASDAELKKDDWTVDKDWDGISVTKPHGIVYVVEGAGGNFMYNPEVQDKPELYKPFTLRYQAKFSFSLVTVDGDEVKVIQRDANGRTIDSWKVTKS